MNDGSAVNEKSTGKHKALNAKLYWLLTGANNISIALIEANHTFLAATGTGSPTAINSFP